jgi:hypothetical protein
VKLIQHYLVYSNRNLLVGVVPPERFRTATRAGLTDSFLRDLSYYARQRMLPLRFIQVDATNGQREVHLD